MHPHSQQIYEQLGDTLCVRSALANTYVDHLERGASVGWPYSQRLSELVLETNCNFSSSGWKYSVRRLFPQPASQSVMYISGIKSSHLCNLAANQLADQASGLLVTESGEDRARWACRHISLLRSSAWAPLWLDYPNKSERDAFCETRLGGKYSGLFHRLLIVLFHSQRHRIRRVETGKQSREEVWKRRETIRYDAVRKWIKRREAGGKKEARAGEETSLSSD